MFKVVFEYRGEIRINAQAYTRQKLHDRVRDILERETKARNIPFDDEDRATVLGGILADHMTTPGFVQEVDDPQAMEYLLLDGNVVR